VFGNHIFTNGESISFQMHRRKPKTLSAAASAIAEAAAAAAATAAAKTKAAKATASKLADEAALKKKEEQRKSLENCDREVVIDVGKRLMLGGVIINHKTGDYRHIKFSAKTYHRMCKMKIFMDRRQRITKDIDEKMGIKQGNYFKRKKKNQQQQQQQQPNQQQQQQQPSSRSSDFEKYAEYTLKHFNEAMQAYGSREYARINYNQWAQTRRTLIQIKRMIIGNGKCVTVIVGDALPAANSPMRGHRGTQTHGLFKLLDEDARCTVHYGSEFRSSKCCCRCGEVLQDARIGESRDMVNFTLFFSTLH